ncbi:MAG TPA: signal peptidase I [Acidothermaceae bacterium]
MATQVVLEPTTTPASKRRDFGSSARLWGGFFGRAWLWFVAGCLVVTFVPMLFGWRPYVIESGSMTPRIKVGDVILSSPEQNPNKLLGHVTVFKDPDPSRAGTVKSHRVVKINPDNTLVTKGDANPTVDPAPVPMSDVKGIGRLLVRWIGLPLIWLQQGAWIKLAMVVLSFWVAAVLVVRDHDDALVDEDDADGDPDGDGDELPGDDRAERDEADADDDIGDDIDDDGDEEAGVAQPARWKPRRSGLTWFSRSRHRRALTKAEMTRMIGARSVVVTVTAGALLLPTTTAAFSASTVNTASTWSAASTFGPNYTSDTKALNPYLYWKLDDATGQNVAVDYSGNSRNGQYSPTPSGATPWTMQQTGGLTGQSPNLAVTAAGGASTNTTCVTTNAAAQNPAVNTYSEIIWFKTTSTQGGKLIGFESSQTGVSNSNSGGQYDRHIYMDGNGALTFGVWTGQTTTVSSGPGYNDGKWHMAVATMGNTGGMRLYVDDVLVGSQAYVTSQNYDALGGGWWRVGCGNLSGWGSYTTQTNYGFAGSLDEATVYTTEISAADVDKLWTDINPAPVIVSLANGDFETGSISPWTCTAGSDISTNSHGGAYAAALTSYGASNNQLGECDQTIRLLPNHTYTLTAWVNRANVGVSGGATGSAGANTGNWRQVSFTFTTDATGSFTVYAQEFNTSRPGYVDDITIS